MNVIVLGKDSEDPVYFPDVRDVYIARDMLVVAYGETTRRYPISSVWYYDIVGDA